MNSKDIVLKSLKHQDIEKVPVDFGATAVTGIHISCVAKLREYYGLKKLPVKVIEPYQMLGEIDKELKNIIGVDIEGVFPKNNMFGFPNENWKEWKMPDGLIVLVPEKFNTTVDNNGVTYIYPQGDTNVFPSGKMPADGYFFDAIIRQEPLDEENLNPEDNLEEFKIFTDEDIAYFENAIRNASLTNRAVIATFGGSAFGDIALVPAPFLKHPKGIRDIEEWYISTIARQDYIHKVFEKQSEIAILNLDKIYKSVGNLVNVVFVCGTDFGTQNSTFCSLDTFRNLYMPYYKKINNWIHKNTQWKTFKHSCGAVESFIPSLVESGFDILNPVQCSAKGMDAELSKQKYGNIISFWGGGVDTQKTLPFGTPSEVREQVLKRCEIFSKNGGFIFNTIHNIQVKTPIENIVAMIDALHEFNSAR
ncbi:MAG: uroporphyrinogen decarboxylase family protein [Candidatus Firestonebacteria bacterium]